MASAAEAERLFREEEIERGRRYARPLYVDRFARTAIALLVLALLAFTPAGDAMTELVDGLPWWAETPVVTALSVAAMSLATLPLAYRVGLVRERRFGLSTQTRRGWLADRAKALAIACVLVGGALLGLAALVRAAPDWWPLAAAAAAVALVLVLGFLAPVVLEPIFNRFEPLGDEELAGRIRTLADRAQVPVRDVLVADASRRTRKLNAYVSGFGKTRRVVVFDTLLSRAGAGEVEAVVAHELAHRRERHVELLAGIGAVAATLGVVVLWLALGDGAGDARRVPEILLVLGGVEFAVAPPLAALSRRLERTADRVALELTGDADAFETMFRTLAETNLADLAPPRALHTLFSSHPTIPERIAAARRFGTVAA
jgi:STE24 endopeptidase